jgi:hypothetical protein
MKATVFIPVDGKVLILDLYYYRIIRGRVYKKLRQGYASINHPDGKGKSLYVHRFVTNCEYSVVDHINRNKLDNRLSNLREATKSVNSINRKAPNGREFKGVSRAGEKNWRAYMTIDGTCYHLGNHKTQIDAARAVNCFIIKRFGYDFCRNDTGDDYSFFTHIPTKLMKQKSWIS